MLPEGSANFPNEWRSKFLAEQVLDYERFFSACIARQSQCPEAVVK
jgi:hypothetical protein